MDSNCTTPVNIGNPDEHTISDFAKIIKDMVGSTSEITHLEAATDDPQRRKPNIEKAKKEIKWQPKVPMMVGLEHTVRYFNTFLPDGSFLTQANFKNSNIQFL